MKIRDKLQIAFLTIALAFGLFGYIEHRQITQLDSSFQALDSNKGPSLTALLEILSATRRASIKVMEFSLHGDPDDRAKALEAIHRIDQEFDRYKALGQNLAASDFTTLLMSKQRFSTVIDEYLQTAEGAAIIKTLSEQAKLHQARKELIHEVSDLMDKVEAPRRFDLLMLKSEARKVSIKLIEFALRGNAQDRQKVLEAMQELRGVLEKIAVDEPLAGLLTGQVTAYLGVAEAYLRLISSQQSAIERIYAKETELHTARTDLIHTLYPLIEDHYEKLTQAADSTTQGIRTASRLQIFSIVLTILIAIILISLLARSISTPLGRLSNLVYRFGRGESISPEEIPTGGAKELRQLGQAVVDMMRERETLEASLKSSEAFARMLLDISPVGLTLTRRDGSFSAANPAFGKITGRSVAETLMLTTGQITPREYHEEDAKQCEFLDRQGRYGPYEKEYLHKDGHRIPVRLSGLLIERDGEQKVWSVVEDITQQWEAASKIENQLQTLRKTEHRLAEAQRVAHIGNWELDLQSEELWWSDEVFRIFELEQQDFPATYRGFLNRVHPDDRGKVNRIYAESVEKQTPYDIIHRILISHERIKYVHERGETQFSETGKALRSIGTVQDITDYHRAQESLRINEQRLALILNTLPHGIQENDIHGVITYSNLAHHRILGYPPGKLVGQHIWDMQTDPQERQALREYLAHLIREQPEPKPYITRNCAQDGRELIVEINWDYQRDTQGSLKGFISVISDVTERHRAEQTLHYRLTLEEALARVSSELAQADPDHLDPVLDASLATIGNAVSADRSYLFLIDRSSGRFSNTHEWCAPGIAAQREELQDLPIAEFQEAFDLFARGEILHVERPETLSDELALLREMMQQIGIASLINVPVLWEGRLVGIVGFDTQDRNKEWPQEDIRLLRTVAENIAWVLARRETAKRDRHHTWFLESLDRISDILTEQNRSSGELARRVTERLLEIFAVDRVWLHYLGEPPTSTFSIQSQAEGSHSPDSAAEIAGGCTHERVPKIILQALRLDHPLVLHTDELTEPPQYLSRFGTRSLITLSLHPQTGEPWLLGMEQASHKRLWSSGERHLFRSIAERIENILSNSQLLEQLQASEHRLLEAERIAQMGEWELDLVTGRAHWSELLHKILGTDPTQTVGPDLLSSLVHADDWPRVEAAMQRSIQEGKEYEVEYRFLRPDGEIRWLFSKARLQLDAEGKPLRLVGIAQDITQRVSMEWELNAYRKHLEQLVEERTATVRQQAQIIDQAHDSVITTDLDGFVTSWNNGAQRLFGFAPDQAIGRHISQVYPKSQLEHLQRDVIAPIKAQGQHEVELIMQRADGSEFPAHLSLSLLYDDQGRPRGMVGYSLDISEQKKREQELALLAQNLQAANKELESFSYSVSHDLRTPLRAIDGFSLALMEDYAHQLDETALDYLNRVRNGAQRMGMLIDDLLQLARVSREPLKLEEVDLSEIASSIIQELQANEPSRNIEYTQDEDIRVMGDARLMRIMLDNLLGNAWKFTSKEAISQITFQRLPGNPQILSIKDNGVGFDMRYADKLFGAFQRLHRVADFPGTGVGLATVQRIVHRHGGKIWAEAREGEGANFYFSLSSNMDRRK